jgi:hypothetical protein
MRSKTRGKSTPTHPKNLKKKKNTHTGAALEASPLTFAQRGGEN